MFSDIESWTRSLSDSAKEVSRVVNEMTGTSSSEDHHQVLLEAGLPEDFSGDSNTSVFKDSLPTDLTSVMNAWSSGVSMLSSISSIQFSSQLTDSVRTGNQLVEETPDQYLLSPPAQRHDSFESSMKHGGELKDPDPDSAVGHPSEGSLDREEETVLPDEVNEVHPLPIPDSHTSSAYLQDEGSAEPEAEVAPTLSLRTELPTSSAETSKASTTDIVTSPSSQSKSVEPSPTLRQTSGGSILDSVWSGVDILRGVTDSAGVRGSSPIVSNFNHALTDAIVSPLKTKPTPEPSESIFDLIDDDDEDNIQQIPQRAQPPVNQFEKALVNTRSTDSNWYAPKKEEFLVNRKNHVEAPVTSDLDPSHDKGRFTSEAVNNSKLQESRRPSRGLLASIANWYVIGTFVCIVVLTGLYKFSIRKPAPHTQSSLRGISPQIELGSNTTSIAYPP